MANTTDPRRLAARAEEGDAAAAAAIDEVMVESLKRKTKARNFRGRKRIGMIGPTDVVDSAVRRYLTALGKKGDCAESVRDPEAVLLYYCHQRVLEEIRNFDTTKKRNRARETGMSALRGVPGGEPTPSATANRRDVAERVATAMRDLEPIDQAIKAGRLIDDKSRDDHAATHDLTPYFLKKRYAAALARLRATLGEDL